MGSAGSLYRHVGKKVEELRLRKKLTQARLAEIVSLSRTSITNIENGRQKLLLHTLWDIAQALGVSPADFFPPTATSLTAPAAAMLKGKLSPKEEKWFSIVTSGGKNANTQTTD